LRERRSAKSANKYGNPVVLKSKVLAVLADPTSAAHVIVAESAGSARRVNVLDESDNDAKATAYRGPTAPVTSLALGGPGGKTLFAGSWDKTVWSFDRDTHQAGLRYGLAGGAGGGGHTDFVKAVVCGRLGDTDVLISGGADKKIIVWDVASGKRLHTLQDSGPTVKGNQQSMLAVQDLAIDPVATTRDEIWLVSASSDPHIRRWRVRLDGWEQVTEDVQDDNNNKEVTASRLKKTLLAHETTVYKVVFEDHNYSGGSDDNGEDVNLWTSSGDGTVKCLSRLHGFQHRDTVGSGSSTFHHRSHVRAVAVTDAWVITAGRDEDLQYWDRTSAADATDSHANSRYASIAGHFDEVTGLVVLSDGRRLCSVSLDGTARTWPLVKADVDALVKQQQEDRAAAAAGIVDDDADKDAEQGGLITADEEAELAALMEDD
jgi:WD40 repeat protein